MNWKLWFNSIQHAETYQGRGACEAPARCELLAESRRRLHQGFCMATRSRWSDLLVNSANRRDPGLHFSLNGGTGFVKSRWGGRR